MITCRWLSADDYFVEDIIDTLDPYTRSRVLNCIQSTKAKEIALGSYLLRHLVAGTLNIDPSDVNIRHSFAGRPYVDPPELFLTSSHCDGICVAAVSDSKAGCDLQSLRAFKGEAVRAFFTDADYEFIKNSNDPSLEMTRIWCIKEAVFKYLSIDHRDPGPIAASLSVSDRETFTKKSQIAIFEDGIEDMIFVVASDAKQNDRVQIKRFEEME